MKKLLVFLLCLLMAVSTFGTLSVNAEGTAPADGLVTFDGYSARTKDFNGIRAQYSL